MTRLRSQKQNTHLKRKLSVNSALTRQSRALESHESKIASHTALQSYIAIVTTIVSFITAVALGYISYLQYKTSSRQVELDYAKIAPQWELNLERRYPRGHGYTTVKGNWDTYPISASITLQRGDAKVNNVSIYQDMEFVRIKRDGKEFYTFICVARIDNYFNWNGKSLSISTNPKAIQLSDLPIWNTNKSTKNSIDKIVANPKDTWVKIEFSDIFGKPREVILHNDGRKSSISPDGMPSKSDIWPVIPVRLADGKSWVGSELIKSYKNSEKDADCEAVFAPFLLK